MPKQLRDFLCEKCGIEEERYIDTQITQTVCSECGGKMIRLMGMPRVSLDGTDPDFPGAYQKWATVREQNARIKAKRSYREP
jgi:hypothetical protein